MTTQPEDDYWNNSSTTKFTFDDEESEEEALEDDGSTVFNSVLQSNTVLPLKSIISTKSLQAVLDDVKLPSANTAYSVDDAISNMVGGESPVLHGYRTLNEKISLLDKAIQTFDGNVILKVLLFLVDTLKQSMFHRYLAKRPLALQQYANYLASLNRFHDLELLYMGTVNKNTLNNLFYYGSEHVDSSVALSKRMDQFAIEHLSLLRDSYEKAIFDDYRKLTKFKLNYNLAAGSATTVLAEMYKTRYRGGNVTDAQISEYVKRMRIPGTQMEWTLINVLVNLKSWDKISELFIKSNWFTKKNVIKSSLDVEVILSALAAHEAPSTLMEDFLKNILDFGRSIELGKKYKCHKFVVDALVARRDKAALLEYKSSLPANSEQMLQIYAAVNSLI